MLPSFTCGSNAEVSFRELCHKKCHRFANPNHICLVFSWQLAIMLGLGSEAMHMPSSKILVDDVALPFTGEIFDQAFQNTV